MTQSALLGQPPATERDVLIRRGILRITGSIFFPNPKHPFGPPRPSPDSPDESRDSQTIALTATLMTAVIIITLGRFAYRSTLKTWKFGLDDLLIIPAALVAVMYLSQILWVNTHGGCYGRHVWFCTYENVEQQYLSFTLGQTIFYFSVYCAKLSIVFFIRRITVSTSTKWKHVHWGLLALITSCGLVSLFGTAFQCVPVTSRFTLLALAQTDRSQYHCIHQNQFQIAVRGLHIGTDLILLSFPIILLSRLQMPIRDKIGICVLFSFGVVCVICSIMRNVVYQHPTEDYSWDSSMLFDWNELDISFAVIVASLPVYYRPILAAYKSIRALIGLPNSTSHATTRSSRSNRQWLDQGTASVVNKFGLSARHNPEATSSHLEGIKGPYTLDHDESITSSGSIPAHNDYNPRYPTDRSEDSILKTQTFELRHFDV